MLRRVFLAVAAVTAFAVMAAPAVAAKGGNSANAQACQKGGWENFVRSDGTPFKNPGACTSYAAKGGVLTTPSTSDPLAAACTQVGGTFNYGEAAVLAPGVYEQPLYWSCVNPNGMTLDEYYAFGAADGVVTACWSNSDGAGNYNGNFSPVYTGPWYEPDSVLVGAQCWGLYQDPNDA